MSWFNRQPKNIPFPRTPEDFDKWAQSIVNKFDLPDTEDTRDALATSLMHLNQSISEYPLEYFRNIVVKSMANNAAYTRLRDYAANREKAKALQAIESAKQADAGVTTNQVVTGDSVTNGQK